MHANDLLPESKAELIERIRQGRAALEAALAPLTPAQMSAVGPESWSIKDHLAHIAAWQRFLLGFMQAGPPHEMLGMQPDTFSKLGLDEINALLYRQARTEAVEVVLADFRETCGQVLKALEELPEEGLQWPYRAVDAGEQGKLIEGIISNTYDHDLEHLGWIRRDFLEWGVGSGE